MNDNQHHDWERLFEQLPLDTTARQEHRAALKSRLGARPGFLATLNSPRLKKIGDILMTYKVPHWTAAAIIVIGVVWLMSLSNARAFAIDELVENVMNARTAKYDMTATLVGGPTQKMKAYYLAPGHSRLELENGSINIADLEAGKLVSLDPKNKRATVLNLTNRPAAARDQMAGNQFELVRDLLHQAQDDPDAKIESLGEKQIGGRTMIGFELVVASQHMTVWADPETRFPATIAATMAGPPETTVVMSNYEFNVKLDEDMFSVAIPEGYQIMETDLDASQPTEDDFVAALRLGSEVTDGKFPDGFDAVAIASYIAKYVIKKGVKPDQLTPENMPMQEIMKISRGFQFAVTRNNESDAHYAGAKATAGDANQPIFWYRPKEWQAYRVIYADFTVRELDEAPVVEAAVKLTP